ncbi:hypothetical protein GTQ45_02055 [Pyruvatibacter mobilis]|uniref:Uncharacterized protein n=1 Tax=Pyruvatibacter mobilis TaxID=1712261 RepID=A0A845Q7D9_9HYPH|nr:hypothetical protein [Pyruvatibacter mobilis]NBG94515.1 hypothetical protein [Pyruvatibacter mobilis]QJD74035.1 hypothetical protein HG718_00605 [Pyruvatibacter mobilis]GGD03556.1 hypothetical protein GCM10011587_04110 [Pyruvatibacter mobilis]
MKFVYYEIRPCVEVDGETRSFLGNTSYNPEIGDMVYTHEGAYEEAAAVAEERGTGVFWTLYGRDTDGQATAIGDFADFDAALNVLNAIIAPIAEARDDLVSLAGLTEPDTADLYALAGDLDDIINQSTTKERL